MMIDMASLPAPLAFDLTEYEQIYQGKLARFKTLYPAWNAALESDPVVMLLELSAYDELAHRAQINDSLRATMLAYAQGSDLDHRAANVGVQRLLLTPENLNTSPPTPAVYESDARLRYRAQLAPEALSVAGPDDGYKKMALDYSASITDVYVYSPSPVYVRVAVLVGEAGPSPELRAGLEQYLMDIKRRPLTDQVTVESAEIIHRTLTANLTIAAGPDPESTKAAARQAFFAGLAAGDPQRRRVRLGQVVDKSLVYAALRQPGVVRVQTDWDDVVCAPNQAVVIDDVILTHETRQ